MKQDLLNLVKEVEQDIKPIFDEVESTCQINSSKVLNAFQRCNLQETHLTSSTGMSLEEIKLKRYIVKFLKRKIVWLELN